MITIIDYGAGNIGSVLNMIRHVGGQAAVARDVAGVMAAEKILLPGVGSFDNAMSRLDKLALVGPLKERAASGIPFLGICLGMQLLANSSEEGSWGGLGLVPGRVRKFRPAEGSNLKVPQMGWNRAAPVRSHPLAQDLDGGARFYFVHSYYFECEHQQDVLFNSFYGQEFASGVQRANVAGVQFHPEKSHRYGMQLIRNFIAL